LPSKSAHRAGAIRVAQRLRQGADRRPAEVLTTSARGWARPAGGRSHSGACAASMAGKQSPQFSAEGWRDPPAPSRIGAKLTRAHGWPGGCSADCGGFIAAMPDLLLLPDTLLQNGVSVDRIQGPVVA